MATPGNIFETYDAVGNREDLSDIIYNIDPTETPFMMLAGRGRASSTLHEWQADELAAAQHSPAAEGDDPTAVAATATVRIKNNTQINEKTIIISGTQEAVDKAGRKSELAYQLAKRAKEIKRDMEFSATQNTVKETGAADAGDARESAGFETWIGTYDGTAGFQDTASRGALGADADHAVDGTPDDAAAPTDGTQRALTETLVKDVLRAVWQNGGDPTVIMCGPFNKQQISSFTGNTTRFDRSEDMRVVTAIDVYVSDFGEHRVIPNRFSRDRSVLIITPRLWSFDYLRSFRQHPLAKSGDSEKRQLLAEWTLRSSNANGSGIVADVTTS